MLGFEILRQNLEKYEVPISELRGALNIEATSDRIAEMEQRIQEPDLWSNGARTGIAASSLIINQAPERFQSSGRNFCRTESPCRSRFRAEDYRLLNEAEQTWESFAEEFESYVCKHF